MKITAAGFPNLHKAFQLIELDNGGHLIGTVYPGTPIDLEAFEVPAEYLADCHTAELEFVKANLGEDEFGDFCYGEERDMISLRDQHGLHTASKLLNLYFDGWQK